MVCSAMEQHQQMSITQRSAHVYLVFAGPRKPIFMAHRRTVLGYRNDQLRFIAKELGGRA